MAKQSVRERWKHKFRPDLAHHARRIQTEIFRGDRKMQIQR